MNGFPKNSEFLLFQWLKYVLNCFTIHSAHIQLKKCFWFHGGNPFPFLIYLGLRKPQCWSPPTMAADWQVSTNDLPTTGAGLQYTWQPSLIKQCFLVTARLPEARQHALTCQICSSLREVRRSLFSTS